MKSIRLFSSVFLLITLSNAAFSQEKIFSLGYGKTFVNNDSSTYTISIDLNRVPGASEKGNGYFFANETFSDSQWGYYVKPTADINLGSATSSAPNNVTVGLSSGLAYDFKETSIGIFTFNLEGSPEIVSDKTLKNSLTYFAIGPYLLFENTSGKLSFLLGAGVNYAIGERRIVTEESNAYQRLGVPINIKLKFWDFKDQQKKRIHLSAIYKFNNVLKDIKSNQNDFNYYNVKFDFYIIPNIGINFTYLNGFEEPLFKENNSYTVGITVAR